MSSADPNELGALRDEELFVLIAHGDERALGALYDRYGRLVFTLALRIVGDRPSTEEVVQDVFQIVWQRTGTFRPEAGSVAAWIVGVTRHRAIDHIRSRLHKARQRDVHIDDALAAVLHDNADAEQVVVARSDVRSALAELPADQRQAIELAYYGGMSAAEIASSMGTPVGTVKTRLRLGLSKLRAALMPGWAATEHADG